MHVLTERLCLLIQTTKSHGSHDVGDNERLETDVARAVPLSGCVELRGPYDEISMVVNKRLIVQIGRAHV